MQNLCSRKCFKMLIVQYRQDLADFQPIIRPLRSLLDIDTSTKSYTFAASNSQSWKTSFGLSYLTETGGTPLFFPPLARGKQKKGRQISQDEGGGEIETDRAAIREKTSTSFTTCYMLIFVNTLCKV